MPSTWVAFMIASQESSAPRRAAPVSVVKNGLPVPPARITIRPLARWCKRRLPRIGLAQRRHGDGRQRARGLAQLLDARAPSRARSSPSRACRSNWRAHARCPCRRPGFPERNCRRRPPPRSRRRVRRPPPDPRRCASTVAPSSPCVWPPCKASPDSLTTTRFHRDAWTIENPRSFNSQASRFVAAPSFHRLPRNPAQQCGAVAHRIGNY